MHGSACTPAVEMHAPCSCVVPGCTAVRAAVALILLTSDSNLSTAAGLQQALNQASPDTRCRPRIILLSSTFNMAATPCAWFLCFSCRAKFIVGSVQQLLAKPGGGEAWLLSLRDKPYNEAHEALCSLPGVGPKVAACICLFSLDKVGAG
jgi:hypothetical protein